MASIRLAEPSDAPLFPGVERSAGQAFGAISHLSHIADDIVQPPERKY